MLVMKFGGASVETPKSFLEIARIVIERSLSHKKIAVVVSAMADTTDKLLRLARNVHPNPPCREQDMLISVGERISISLLAMAFACEGVEAVSFTGSQSGIITCENHSNASILDVRPKRIEEVLEQGKIAIIAGFQGVSLTGEITTLGRGGSDTSAVALGIGLGAPCVEFYKDVSGIFEKDPKVHPEAKRYARLSYVEALEIIAGGAEILHERSIKLAEKNKIQICIRSFKEPTETGTIVGLKEGINSKFYEVETCSLI